jgi:hypothetical protein
MLPAALRTCDSTGVLVVGAVAYTIRNVAALGIGALSLATNGMATYQDCEHGFSVNCGTDAAGDALSVADFGLDFWPV